MLILINLNNKILIDCFEYKKKNVNKMRETALIYLKIGIFYIINDAT